MPAQYAHIIVVMHDASCKKVAVSSDRWAPFVEVAEAGLEGYLQHMKALGWVVVALEQASDSVFTDIRMHVCVHDLCDRPYIDGFLLLHQYRSRCSAIHSRQKQSCC